MSVSRPSVSSVPQSLQSFDLDGYVVDTLMPDLVGHDRSPSAFLVYLCLYRRGRGTGEQTPRLVSLSLSEIAEQTGVSKRAVQSALGLLERRRLLQVTRGRPGFPSSYRVTTPWRRNRGA